MNVQMPDGRVVEFPDSMSQEAISAELEKISPAASPAASTTAPAVAPAPAWARVPLGIAAATAGGMANTLALPGAALDLIRPAGAWMAEKAGLPAWAAGPASMLHLVNPAEMSSITKEAGLTENPRLAPQSEPERLAQAGAAGLGGALPLLALGGPLGLAAGGIAGGVAGEGARALGAPEPVQLAAGLAAGLGVQGMAGALARGVSHVAADLGTSSTLQEAGEAAQDLARGWLAKVPAGQPLVPGTLQANLASAWAPVDALVPRAASTPLTNFHSALESISTDAGDLAPLERLLRPSLPERLREAVFGSPGEASIPPMARPGRASTSGLAGERVINPTVGPATPVASGRVINQPGLVGTGPATWQDVSKLRSAVGEAMANPKIANDIGAENLSHLYSALTADMQQTASGLGPRAALAFDAANRESSRLYGIAQGPVARIVSGPKPNVVEDPKPGDVASYFLNKARRDGSELALLRGELPQAVDELAAAHLRLNPDARAWQRLAPEAQEALVPNSTDRAIVAGAWQPKVAVRDQVERSILGTLLGEVLLPAVSGLPPGIATATGALGGAAVPYAVQGARSALRNPLYGISGAAGAGANPASPGMAYRLATPPANLLSP